MFRTRECNKDWVENVTKNLVVFDTCGVIDESSFIYIYIGISSLV